MQLSEIKSRIKTPEGAKQVIKACGEGGTSFNERRSWFDALVLIEQSGVLTNEELKEALQEILHRDGAKMVLVNLLTRMGELDEAYALTCELEQSLAGQYGQSSALKLKARIEEQMGVDSSQTRLKYADVVRGSLK